MKKLLFLLPLLLLFFLPSHKASATALPLQTVYPQTLGFLPTNLQTNSTFVISSSTKSAISFVLPVTKTLSSYSFYVASISGAQGATDVTVGLYDDSGNHVTPGTLIESHAGTVAAAATTWETVSGFTTVLQGGSRYWMQITNANTGASSFTVVFLRQGNNQFAYSSSWGQVQTDWTGSSWSTATIAAVGYMTFNDNTYFGSNIQNSANVTATNGVYSTRELGVLFTTPSGPTINVAGIDCVVREQGTVTDNYSFNLRNSSGTLIASTATTTTTVLATSLTHVYNYFTNIQSLSPSTQYRVTFGLENGTGNTTNYLGTIGFTASSTQFSVVPWFSSWGGTYYNGTSWDDATYANVMYPCGLILENTTPFITTAGGGTTTSAFFSYNWHRFTDFLHRTFNNAYSDIAAYFKRQLLAYAKK